MAERAGSYVDRSSVDAPRTPHQHLRIPRELRTKRLTMRVWRGSDAEELRPILLANHDHLSPWIPETSYSAPPLPQLAERLEEFVSRFDEGVAFRYALRNARDGRILGAMSLFPRNDTSRVPLAEADRVEIGYWLDRAMTGQGLVTEAVVTLLDVARTLAGVGSVEIHCHKDNAPSNGVPRRLGFELAGVHGEMQVWRKVLG